MKGDSSKAFEFKGKYFKIIHLMPWKMLMHARDCSKDQTQDEDEKEELQTMKVEISRVQAL